MQNFAAQFRAFLAKDSFALVVGAVTLVTGIAAAKVAIPARRQKAEMQAESARLEAVIASSNRWVMQFQPATDEEAAIWQSSSAEAQALGVKPSERLTIAQIVARRANDAGYVLPHIKFQPGDATTPVPARNVAGVTFNPAPYKLLVTGAGGFATLANFLASLPPAVNLQSVTMVRTGDSDVNTSITLSVFEPVGTNGQ